MGVDEVAKPKRYDAMGRPVYDEEVNTDVIVDYVHIGNGELEVVGINIPSKLKLIEDLKDAIFQTELEDSDVCEGFEPTKEWEAYLDEWDEDWENILPEDTFCQICKRYSQCHNGAEPPEVEDVKKEIKKETGEETPERTSRPFRREIG